MTIDISNNDPRVSYSVAESVGQSIFSVPFEFFNDPDLNVYVDGSLKAEIADYTVSGGDGSTGSITFVAPVVGASGGSTVTITRDIALERLTDFVAGQDINRAALNEQLDVIVAQIADVDDKASRAFQLNDYEPAGTLVMPSLDDRKGTVLAFNATTGNMEAGPQISAIAADVASAAASAEAAATSASNAAASEVQVDAKSQAIIYSIALG